MMDAGERTRLEAALVRVRVLEGVVARRDADILRLSAVAVELRADNDRLRRELGAARGQVDELTARLARLEAVVLVSGKTSSNSAMPPSSDGPAARNQRRYPSRERSGLPAGGQIGHAPGVLAPRPATAVVEHRPTVCACGEPLETAPVVGAKTRQVIDVEVTVCAVEHRVLRCKCGSCGQVTTGVFPAAAGGARGGPVVWGPGVKAAAVAVAAGGQIPSRVTATLLANLFGVAPSSAAITGWCDELAASLNEFDTQCASMLQAADVLGADESPIRVEGFPHAHAHVAVTDTITRFHLADRSIVGIKAGGILDNYEGTTVTDCLSSYWSVTNGAHQACLAHLIRELRYFTETFPTGAHPAFGQLVETLRQAIHTDTIDDHPATVTRLCADGLAGLDVEITSRTAATTEGKAMALLKRLQRLNTSGDLWRFITQSGVPPTNNWSEQPIRPLKVKQRRSGCFRSVQGARTHLRIAGYLDTARKHGHDPIEALRDAFAGNPLTIG